MASVAGPEGRRGILEYMAAKRPAIANELRSIADRRGRVLQGRMAGGADLMGRIVEMSLKGKMIRGCLVFLGRDVAVPKDVAVPRDATVPTDAARPDGEVVGLAAAMELFQTGLLVHDDIMDRDTLRRGGPTIHASYASELRDAGIEESGRFGEALGICAGDACYFEAFAALAPTLAGKPRASEILAVCAEFLSEVVVAQMADVRWGASETEASEADILAMYRFKTARYSFSLPLAVGALSAGSDALAPPLIELGELLGTLFQLRDDELGLFGDMASTGKGVGSDLREGKKTLFRARLLAAAPSRELPRLAALFGGTVEAGPEDIAYIRRLSEELGVMRSIVELSRKSEVEARAIIRALARPIASERGGGLAPETAGLLEDMVEYVTRREK